MNHGDAFAGIGGFGLAARRAGMRTVWACEIEPTARAIYSARLGVERFDSDIRESRNLPALDVLTGGFPCQDLSVAGKRAGLAGGRSGLFFELVRILEESRPEWFVFENVPGLLSSNQGRDMGVALSTLVECGYGVAYRVLNAQFFGVPQRRRRVFIVGHSSGDERRAAAVLLEPQGLRRNPSQSGEERQDVAGALGSLASGGFRTTDLDGQGAFVVAGPLTRRYGKGINTTMDDGALVTHSLRAEGFDASEDGTGRGTPLVANTLDSHYYKGTGSRGGAERTVVAPTLRCGGMADAKRPAGAGSDNVPLVFDPQQLTHRENRSNPRPGDPSQTLAGQPPAVIGPPPDPHGMRATPGLPRPLDLCPICEDGPDSPRYRGLGNAVAVPVVEWILKRIAAA